MSIDFHIGIAVLGLGLLLIAVYAYRNTTPPVSGRVRLALVSLRIAAFLFVVFLLTDPRFIYRSKTRSPAHVIALVDRSASMSLPAVGWSEGGERRFDVALDVVERVRPVIEQRGGRFSTVYFANDAEVLPADSVAPDGQGTDIARSLETTYKKYEGENVAGVVLISDGIETEERLVRESPPPVPVYAIGVGDTSAPEDVRISDLDYAAVVRAPSKTKVKVTLHYSGAGSKRVQLQLREGDRTVFEKDTLLTSTSRELAQEIPVEFRKPGRRRFVLEAGVDGLDVELDNNRRELAIVAEKAGVKILIVDLLPAWELHFLTDFLRQDETFDFDLVTGFADRLNPSDGKIVNPAEFTRVLDDYDALVLSSVTPAFFSGPVAAAIKRYVQDLGRGVLVLPGHSSLFEQSSAWASLSDLLPVKGNPPHRFQLQFTGVRPGAQAATNPITAQLVPLLSQAQWQERSPLLGFYAQLVPKSGVEVLLETEQRRTPVFTYHTMGKGRVAVLSAGPIWRWKFLVEGGGLYDEMISRVLDVLSRGENTERFVLVSRRNVYDSGEGPVLTAEIFNEKMQPVTGVPVRLEISKVHEDGSEVPLDIVTMQREGADNPRFKAELMPLPSGNYRVRGSAALPGRSIASETLDISVSDVSVEFQDVARDRAGLVGIAAQTGGAYIEVSAVEDLVRSMALEERMEETTAEKSLRSSAIVFAVILLLLAVEWIIRKRVGMI